MAALHAADFTQSEEPLGVRNYGLLLCIFRKPVLNSAQMQTLLKSVVIPLLKLH